ncbi:sensor domain-containing protein [Clostridium sp.]|uniref:sensor domain-containing protein n=1 Tax=Clostridium sp. TaxID=1506 RepID=UPI0026242AE2|nr:sensor domain-containing protein [Clostridium sp.]
MNDLYMNYNQILQKVLKPFERSFIYLLLSLPIGIIYFTFAVCAVSLGFGLSITVIGIPIIASTLICTNKIVDYEKIIAAKILDTNINVAIEEKNTSKDNGALKRMIEMIKSPRSWKGVIYCIVKFPVSIIHFSAVTCLTSLSLGITFQPIIFAISGTMGVDVYKSSITIGRLTGFQKPNFVDFFLCPILGVIVTFFSIKLINVLAKRWAEFTLKF